MMWQKLEVLFRRTLCAVLRIESWHAAPAARHPYRRDICERINATRPQSVLEIGCGFADIICAISAQRKLATDVSSKVLAGARICHLWSWMGGQLRFSKYRLGDRIDGKFDAIVCVNFVHVIAPDVFSAALMRLISENLTANGTLVFDVVRNPSYRFNHSPDALLAKSQCSWIVQGGYEFGRSLVFVKKPPELL